MQEGDPFLKQNSTAKLDLNCWFFHLQFFLCDRYMEAIRKLKKENKLNFLRTIHVTWIPGTCMV